jgi:hypothetical protein
MPVSEKAMQLELQSIGEHGAPTLGPAFEVLRDQWRVGERDRELALHLMFLAWYLNIEPSHLTGLDETRIPSKDLLEVFNEAHEWLLPDGAASEDAEALYAAGLPARMFPWVLGDERTWAARSESYRARYRQLAPDGLAASVFDGRGAYGDYYRQQVQVVGGY